jgi:hypothetical protein
LPYQRKVGLLLLLLLSSNSSFSSSLACFFGVCVFFCFWVSVIFVCFLGVSVCVCVCVLGKFWVGNNFVVGYFGVLRLL